MSQPFLQDLTLEGVVRVATEYGLSHVQIDPNDYIGSVDIKKKLNGYLTIPTTSLMLRNTVIIDLSMDEEILLANMKKNTRYNCKLAEKKGVKVEFTYELEAIDVFNKLFSETIAAKHFHGRNPEYYKEIWNILAPIKKAVMAIAYYEGEPVVARMLFLGGETIYTAYTGTSRRYSDIKAAYGALWEVILWGKSKGYKYINLWGVDPDAKEGDGKYGFTQFKVGFGGSVVEYESAFDLVIHPMAYLGFRIGNVARRISLG
jgi:lipid II:glycine glycyltransferase (peptidoglycan interpeptide bridge formation enzyme)